ncbi:MAG TPA: citrate/2-methylcitrate synthase [Deferrisomatales bacterium]|nr:citrate/2-methylcitrate synthase [Deferrisomatales bacterium]
MKQDSQAITKLILKAARKAREETSNEPEPDLVKPVRWPVQCTVGPGLEGAIACESKVGYVNGSKGWLVYRGYDIFDLCAYSTFEEVSYLLIHGKLPSPSELAEYKGRLIEYRYLNQTLRLLLGFPLEQMNTMSALRMGTNMMRQEFTHRDERSGQPVFSDIIGSDEDSIPMETAPKGNRRAIYEFRRKNKAMRSRANELFDKASGIEACYHLLSGVATVAAMIARVNRGAMPIDPDPTLSFAANFLYMMNGRRPTPVEERVMDVALILHADHGMNASTFASMVVASTLSDVYFSIGSGIAALNGPLHGGANEQVMHTLSAAYDSGDPRAWIRKVLEKKNKVPGFGHRVYKAYDPRARVLGPLAKYLVRDNPEVRPLQETAEVLEAEVVAKLGAEKQVFPNVDFYSGLVYRCLGIDSEMFTPVFAVSRVAGWTARVQEYMERNRIFRPRARYTGEFNKQYVPVGER